MRRLLTGLLLLMVFSALPAQQLTQEKNLSMWELKGPVKTLLETSYRSDRFDVDGLRLVRYERSVPLYYEEFVFDSLHSLTYYYAYHKNGNKEDYERYGFDSLHRIISMVYGEGRAHRQRRHLSAEGRNPGEDRNPEGDRNSEEGGSSGDGLNSDDDRSSEGERMQERITYHYNQLQQLYLANHYNDSNQLKLQTTYRYKRDRIAEIKIYSQEKILWSHSRFSYDSSGNLVEMRNVKTPLLQNRPYAFRYAYDQRQLKTREQYFNDMDLMQWETVFSYDKRKRLVEEVTYDGQQKLQKRIGYTYNRKNLLIKEMRQDAARTQQIAYFYDKLGRLTLSSNVFGDVDYRIFYLEYDHYGNWTDKVEYDGLQMRVTHREFTYFDHE